MVARTPLQSLTRFDKLVNPDGTPTEFFMRLLQNSNILAGDTQTQVETNTADIATIEAFTVNTSDQITGGPVSIGSAVSVTIGHGPSGVAPGTYGDAANIPQITVDAEGHVTAASELALALAVTTVEVDLGMPARRSGSFTIAGVGMTIGKPVFIQKAAGPYTGKGTRADEAEMDPVTVTGIVESATVIRCWWQSPSFVRGNIKFDYFIGA